MNRTIKSQKTKAQLGINLFPRRRTELLELFATFTLSHIIVDITTVQGRLIFHLALKDSEAIVLEFWSFILYLMAYAMIVSSLSTSHSTQAARAAIYFQSILLVVQ